MPREKPTDCHAVDRRISGCPLRECEPWIWSALHTWNDWSLFRGLPEGGSLSEQSARLIGALSILESESGLVRAYDHEVHMRRAKSRRG